MHAMNGVLPPPTGLRRRKRPIIVLVVRAGGRVPSREEGRRGGVYAEVAKLGTVVQVGGGDGRADEIKVETRE